MKKQKVQLIIMLAVLVLLGGGYWGLRRYNEIQSEQVPEETGDALVDLEAEDVDRLTFDYEGVEYTYEKTEDVWYYTEDKTLNLDQLRVGNLVDQLCELEADDTITEVTDLSQYGLAEPAQTVTFGNDGQQYTFCVGDYNDITSIYYTCRPGESTVYTVKSTAFDLMNFSPQDIVEEEESTETQSE